MELQGESHSTILKSTDSFNNTISTYHLKQGANYVGLQPIISVSQNF